MAVAALDAGDRDMRRRGQAERDCPVVATGAIGVAREVNISAACPTGEARRGVGVTGDAVSPTGRHMTWERTQSLARP